MKMKWDSHENGTILNDPVLSPRSSEGDVTRMKAMHHTNSEDDQDDGSNISEFSRLNDDMENNEELSLFAVPKSTWSLYRGIAYSSLSSLFFSLCSVIVKYLGDIHPGELAVFRFVGIFILTVPLVIRNGHNPLGPPELRHYLILRGIAGATSLFLRFYAFRYLPIADASVIIFSVPVFVSFFAKIFLNEPCGIFQTFTVSLTMIGLALTTKLPILFNSNTDSINGTSSMTDSQTDEITTHMYGVIAAISSTFFAASVYIVVRKVKKAQWSIIMFNFGWVAIVETTILTAFLDGFSIPTTFNEWILITILGIFSFCGQVLLTRSLQLEQAGPVSVVRSATDIALAFVWQLWLFKDIPDVWSITGAFLVTLCISLTSIRKWVVSLPDHSSVKRRLYLLTI